MAFTVNDFTDLTRLLAGHPEWQAELRRLLLSDEFMALPAIVRDLAEAQKRTEARLEQLAEAQERTEARLERLTERVDALSDRVDELARSLSLLVEQVRELVEWQKRTDAKLGDMKGDLLELRYSRHAAGYFGRWLKKAQVVDPVTLEDSLEGALSHDELLAQHHADHTE